VDFEESYQRLQNGPELPGYQRPCGALHLRATAGDPERQRVIRRELRRGAEEVRTASTGVAHGRTNADWQGVGAVAGHWRPGDALCLAVRDSPPLNVAELSSTRLTSGLRPGKICTLTTRSDRACAVQALANSPKRSESAARA
jgi:hypothetical protein